MRYNSRCRRGGGGFLYLSDGQGIMDRVVLFVETVDRGISSWIDGDLATIRYTFDGRCCDDVNILIVGADCGTNGTRNGGRRANVETKLPEMMLRVEFSMFRTTKDIETAEDREETDGAKIRFDGKVVFVSGNRRITV